MLEIKRTLTPELRDHLQKPEITLLVGPRQAGKTTLLKELAADLRAEGNKTLFYNLDIARDREHFIGQEQFIDQVQAKTGNKRHYVFINEIQRLENAGLFLKGIFDRDLPHKLTNLNTATLKNYLWYAEKTFIIQSLNPYFTNKEKEIVKAPAYYFLDLGLRNFLRGIYDDPADQGLRFQTLVFRLLEHRFRHSVTSLHFWRTKAKAEVDFVVNRGYDLLPVEVKSAYLKQPHRCQGVTRVRLKKLNIPK